MFTLISDFEKSTTIIKKSTFITIVSKVNNKDELNNFLSKYSDPNATHNCYAYKIGVENQFAGFSDDGEPNGTAGKPIFNVIEKMNITNIVVLVIRYFGGIKLGAGPLTRAYGSCASSLLKELEIRELKKVWSFKIESNIANTKFINSWLNENNIKNYTKQYEGDLMTISFFKDNENLTNLQNFGKIIKKSKQII